MKTIRLLLEKHGQFLRFCIVGGINTGISIAVFNLLIFGGVDYLIGTVLGYMAGLINGYFLSSRYVFKGIRSKVTAFKFLGVYMSALVINLGLMYMMVDFLGMNPSLSQFLLIVFNVGYNFVLNKMWTFKDK